MKRLLSFLTCVSIVLAALAGCGTVPTPTAPHLTYQVGPCDQSIPMDRLAQWAGVKITAQDGAIQVEQRIRYVCCAEIQVTMHQEGSVVKIVETNVGDICKCMCGYEAHMEITGLPSGRYTVQVWGVQYPEVHPLELLGEAAVDL